MEGVQREAKRVWGWNKVLTSYIRSYSHVYNIYHQNKNRGEEVCGDWFQRLCHPIWWKWRHRYKNTPTFWHSCGDLQLNVIGFECHLQGSSTSGLVRTIRISLKRGWSTSSLWRRWIWETWKSFALATTTQVGKEKALLTKMKQHGLWKWMTRYRYCNQGVHLAGSWTGSRSTPPLRVRDCASHVAAGWIKEKMMGRSWGIFIPPSYRLNSTCHVRAQLWKKCWNPLVKVVMCWSYPQKSLKFYSSDSVEACAGSVFKALCLKRVLVRSLTLWFCL